MSLLQENRNCWKVTDADHGAFSIDGARYFCDLAAAMSAAKHTIFIVGWELHTRTQLNPTDEKNASRFELINFLRNLTERNQNLQIRVLIWNHSSVFVLYRELFQRLKFRLFGNNRIHFIKDRQHPLGASHHQKIIVIDDRIAYVGGFDLALDRWDTSRHLPANPRRKNVNGRSYLPFHDIQLRVEGNAARHLGTLVRDRWYRATGEVLEEIYSGVTDKHSYPVASADFHDARVGISRTQPAYDGFSRVAEIETLTTDLILSARNYLYIENQYLSSKKITETLVTILRRKDGPEVILILPKVYYGWFERRALAAARDYLARVLMRNDLHGKLGIFYPAIAGSNDGIMVHSKVLIVDDRYLSIGSANLSERSMSLDTECQITLDASDNPDLQNSVRRFRDRLLREHLGLRTERLGNILHSDPSLLHLIRLFQNENSGRGLRQVEPQRISRFADFLYRLHLADRSQPFLITRFAEFFRSHLHMIPHSSYQQVLGTRTKPHETGG